MTLNCKCE